MEENQITNNIDNELDHFKQKITHHNLAKCKEISVWISNQIDLDDISKQNHRIKESHERLWHPIRPVRREIYMVEMGCNVGVEFKDYHPALIIQNDTGNTYGDTTIILPITELDGRIDHNIHKKITNLDFESFERNGLDKDPSIIKLADICTIDKARLNTRIGKVKIEFMNDVERKMKNILKFR